jgi:SAM-dependent methyltransferase
MLGSLTVDHLMNGNKNLSARSESYRYSHCGAKKGEEYESMYSDGGNKGKIVDRFSYARWLIEQEDVIGFLENNPDLRTGQYLDFACGTGRWTALLESYFADSVGVDVSSDMLNIAKEKCKETQFIISDITKDNDLSEKQFKFITAFRFFLRAENSLRLSVLKELNTLLADDGVFVFNIHDNKHSLNWPLFLLSAITGKESPVKSEYDIGKRPHIAKKNMLEMLDQTGFQVVSISYLGVIPNMLYGLPWFSSMYLRIDRFLYRKNLSKHLAIERIYYCKKK